MCEDESICEKVVTETSESESEVRKKRKVRGEVRKKRKVRGEVRKKRKVRGEVRKKRKVRGEVRKKRKVKGRKEKEIEQWGVGIALCPHYMTWHVDALVRVSVVEKTINYYLYAFLYLIIILSQWLINWQTCVWHTY